MVVRVWVWSYLVEWVVFETINVSDQLVIVVFVLSADWLLSTCCCAFILSVDCCGLFPIKRSFALLPVDSSRIDRIIRKIALGIAVHLSCNIHKMCVYVCVCERVRLYCYRLAIQWGVVTSEPAYVLQFYMSTLQLHLYQILLNNNNNNNNIGRNGLATSNEGDVYGL